MAFRAESYAFPRTSHGCQLDCLSGALRAFLVLREPKKFWDSGVRDGSADENVGSRLQGWHMISGIIETPRAIKTEPEATVP